jgi:hypothetical protein
MQGEIMKETKAMAALQSAVIVLSARGLKSQRVPVVTADQASAVWSRFRDANNLGGSDLKRDSGHILSPDGSLIAKVSYNGRVWTPDDRLLQEPPDGPCGFPVPASRMA